MPTETMLPKGLRRGKAIGVFYTEEVDGKEVTKVTWTDHKSINAAKRANRLTRYPIVRGKGE